MEFADSRRGIPGSGLDFQKTLSAYFDRDLRRAFINTSVAGIKLIVNVAMVYENDEYLDGAFLALYL